MRENSIVVQVIEVPMSPFLSGELVFQGLQWIVGSVGRDTAMLEVEVNPTNEYTCRIEGLASEMGALTTAPVHICTFALIEINKINDLYKGNGHT